MLESMRMYGYTGIGFTGEDTPDAGFTKVNMPYWEYKKHYPECRNCGDYNKEKKTITVLIPDEYTKRPNYGNRYELSEFYFRVFDNERFAANNYREDLKHHCYYTFMVKAKNRKNAERNMKVLCRKRNYTFIEEVE